MSKSFQNMTQSKIGRREAFQLVTAGTIMTAATQEPQPAFAAAMEVEESMRKMKEFESQHDMAQLTQAQ